MIGKINRATKQITLNEMYMLWNRYASDRIASALNANDFKAHVASVKPGYKIDGALIRKVVNKTSQNSEEKLRDFFNKETRYLCNDDPTTLIQFLNERAALKGREFRFGAATVMKFLNERKAAEKARQTAYSDYQYGW